MLCFTGGSVADDEGSESSGGGDNADESMEWYHLTVLLGCLFDHCSVGLS